MLFAATTTSSQKSGMAALLSSLRNPPLSRIAGQYRINMFTGTPFPNMWPNLELAGHIKTKNNPARSQTNPSEGLGLLVLLGL